MTASEACDALNVKAASDTTSLCRGGSRSVVLASEERNDPQDKPVAFVILVGRVLFSDEPNNPRGKPVGFMASLPRSEVTKLY